jgi:Protein of unknown function (DUF2474)
MPLSHHGALSRAGPDSRVFRTIAAKVAWFVGIWACSVLALGIVAIMIRWALRP